MQDRWCSALRESAAATRPTAVAFMPGGIVPTRRWSALLVVLIAVSFASAGTEPGMPRVLDALGCDRLVSTADVHSTGDKGVRVDEIRLCIRQASDRTVLVFRATSTREHVNYPDRRHAPWLDLTVVSASGEKTILRHIVRARVSPCGGSEIHVSRLHSLTASRVAHFSVSVDKSEGATCTTASDPALPTRNEIGEAARWLKGG